MISGFVVEANDIWFYVTAGHVVGRLHEAMNAGVTFDAWRLDDQTAGGGYQHPIPYDFDIDRWSVLRDDKIGIDYAITPLVGLICEGLRAGGVIPIDREAWEAIPIAECEHLFLVGVAHETVHSPRFGIITAKVSLIPLKVTSPPRQAGDTEQNMFFAQLIMDSEQPGSRINDIGGMSGGPIFGAKKLGDETKYWAVGVQSGWYSDSKIIAACPISSFMEALEVAIKGMVEPK